MRRHHGIAARLLAVALLAGVAAGEARAQTQTYLYTRFNVEGWVFAPAVVDGYIFGFLVWANTTDTTHDTVTTTGGNLKVMWCQRDDTQAWSVWAWQSAGPAEAALWVRQLLEAPAAFELDLNLPVWIYESNVTTPAAPSQVKDGLFWDDPVQVAMATAPDKAALADMLAGMGYTAAPVLSALDAAAAEPCDPAATTALDAALNSFTREADLSMFGQSLIASACAWPCKCATGVATAAAPTGWVCHQYNQPNAVLCDCQNQWTSTVTDTGKYKVCLSCAGTTTTNVKCENAREQYELGHVCGAAPDPTTMTTFTPGRCAGW